MDCKNCYDKLICLCPFELNITEFFEEEYKIQKQNEYFELSFKYFVNNEIISRKKINKKC